MIRIDELAQQSGGYWCIPSSRRQVTFCGKNVIRNLKQWQEADKSTVFGISKFEDEVDSSNVALHIHHLSRFAGVSIGVQSLFSSWGWTISLCLHLSWVLDSIKLQQAKSWWQKKAIDNFLCIVPLRTLTMGDSVMIFFSSQVFLF